MINPSTPMGFAWIARLRRGGKLFVLTAGHSNRKKAHIALVDAAKSIEGVTNARLTALIDKGLLSLVYVDL